MTVHAISDEAFETLMHVIEGFLVLSFKFKLALRPLLYETTFPRDKVILNFKQTQGCVWFMLEGLAREIKEDRETLEEQTSWFWAELGFVCTDPGFFSQQQSSRAVQVTETSRVVFIAYANWKRLRDAFPEAELVTERIRSFCSAERQLHAEQVKQLGTEERYLAKEVLLLDLFSRVKLKFIAEYMGMAPDTLGRLRKKFSGRR